jgi:hypothetical protein
MQQEAKHHDEIRKQVSTEIKANFDCTMIGGCINQLSDIHQTMLAELAKHMGKR